MSITLERRAATEWDADTFAHQAMKPPGRTLESRRRMFPVLLCALGFLLTASVDLFAGRIIRGSAVGGIRINSAGILAAPVKRDLLEIREIRHKALDEIDQQLTPHTSLRKISLRRLDEAIQRHRATKFVPLPDSIKYLAGLQRVQYIFVYPETNDIVLAGPAEGWKVDRIGNVVGVTTNRPVLLLDDLMVALRVATAAPEAGMSCSIDPTAEGLQNVRSLFKRLKTIGNPKQTLGKIEKSLGPQVITVDGVPASSHFARVMVAADFRMKRLAMNFERAPIRGLPSYLSMLRGSGRGLKNMLPRWWLTTNYEPLLTDEQGLAWEIRGQGVRCMTEEDHVNQDGTREPSGKSSAVAQRWADTMTAKYEELAGVDSAFAQLRNIMDVAVAATVISKESLLVRAGVELPFLLKEEMIGMYNSPRRVDSKANFVKKGRNYLISASGGVQMYPIDIIQNVEESQTLDPKRAQSVPAGVEWWWN